MLLISYSLDASITEDINITQFLMYYRVEIDTLFGKLVQTTD